MRRAVKVRVSEPRGSRRHSLSAAWVPTAQPSEFRIFFIWVLAFIKCKRGDMPILKSPCKPLLLSLPARWNLSFLMDCAPRASGYQFVYVFIVSEKQGDGTVEVMLVRKSSSETSPSNQGILEQCKTL